MRLLFFLERELHLPMLVPLMQEAHRRNLGEIGVSTVQYVASSDGMPGRGLRQRVVEEAVNVPFTIVHHPHEWRPDITFMADFSYQYAEGLGRIVNVGHGTICKGWFFSRKLISRRENCADLLCVPGEVHAEALREQVYIPIAVTGMPKLDAVFRGDYPREETLRRHGLDPRNKTVLFAPTFNSELSVVPHVGQDLRRFIPDYMNIFIKLHGAAPEEQKRAYRAYAEATPNVAYSESMDIGPAFAASDVLLSDVSSVIFEFLSLGKPVVAFDSPTMTSYPGYDPDDLEHVYRHACFRFGDVSQLKETISRALLSNLTEEQREIGDRFVSVRDGSASAQVIDRALALLNDASPRASIIIRDDGGDELPRLIEKWSVRHQLLVSTHKAARAGAAVRLAWAESPFEIIREALPHVQCDSIIYYDAAWTPSPMLPDFLLTHLRFDSEAGVVCPLLQTNDGGLQSLGLHVRFQQQVPPELVGWQLTYSMTGRAKHADLLDSPVFAIRRSAMCGSLTTPADARLSWLETLRCAHLAGMGQSLALDVCARPVEKPRPTLMMTSVEEPSVSDEDETNRLLRAIEADPTDKSTLRALIDHYFANEKWELVDVYAAMLPGDAEVALLHARSLMQQEMHEQALDELEKIDTLDIADRDLLFGILAHKGRLLMKAQRVDEAKHHLQEALRLRPDDVTVTVNLGTCALFENDAEAALARFNTALGSDYSCYDALFGSALAHHSQQRFDQAEQCFGRILDRTPSDMKALKTMLQFAYESRRFLAVEQRLQAYLQTRPEDAAMRFVLAGVLYEQGRHVQALESVNRVLAADPEFTGGAELREKIQSTMHP